MAASTKKPAVSKIEIRYVPAAQVGEVFLKVLSNDPTAYLPYKDMEVVDVPGIAAQRRAVNHPKNLDTIYLNYQVLSGDKNERTAQLRIRSMGYGDAIVHEGRAYYVSTTGFVFRDASGNFVPVTEESITALNAKTDAVPAV